MYLYDYDRLTEDLKTKHYVIDHTFRWESYIDEQAKLKLTDDQIGEACNEIKRESYEMVKAYDTQWKLVWDPIFNELVAIIKKHLKQNGYHTRATSDRINVTNCGLGVNAYIKPGGVTRRNKYIHELYVLSVSMKTKSVHLCSMHYNLHHTQDEQQKILDTLTQSFANQQKWLVIKHEIDALIDSYLLYHNRTWPLI